MQTLMSVMEVIHVHRPVTTPLVVLCVAVEVDTDCRVMVSLVKVSVDMCMCGVKPGSQSYDSATLATVTHNQHRVFVG